MTRNFSPNDNNDDLAVTAIKPAGGSGTTTLPLVSTYAYAGTGYANPHAVTSVGNGTATTTYAYDNSGNLTSSILKSGSNSTTTLYTWDYSNRLTKVAIGSGGSTTTSSYAYDWLGQRVQQIIGSLTGATTTVQFPSKLYSKSIGTIGATTTATTTAYIFSGDTLLSNIEGNGTATSTYYVHPDHLGSTQLLTNSSGTTKQTLDYYPYGSTRISTNTGGADSKRKFIGEFSDAESSLSYLNARYYEGSRGQFLSQDPMFLGDPKQQNLQDPQSLNSYSYANDNPINRSDPNGLYSLWQVANGQATWGQYWSDVNDGAMMMGQNSGWNFAFDHPYITGATVGVGAGAAYSLPAAAVALGDASWFPLGPRVVSNLGRLSELPQTAGAAEKLGALGQRLGQTSSEILSKASASGKPFVDLKASNLGNINVLLQQTGSTLTRITTNPQITRIISAGTIQSSVAQNISRMVPLLNSLSGALKVLQKLISK